MSEFHSLLEAEIPRLRRYARALVRDRDRADDLVQDTLMRALAKQHLWEPGTNLRAWLFTLMHNLHVNLVRQAVDEAQALASLTVVPQLVLPTLAEEKVQSIHNWALHQRAIFQVAVS